MGNRKYILMVAVVLAAIAGSAVAGSMGIGSCPSCVAGQGELPIGTENEVSRYNQCEKIEPGKWECTTCFESEIRQQSVCTREITSNPSPSNP